MIHTDMNFLCLACSFFFIINSALCIRTSSDSNINYYIRLLKTGHWSHSVTTRLKSISANGFVTFSNSSSIITAKASKQEAFKEKYALIQIHKSGQIAALYNDATDSYICFNDNGYLVKTKKDEFNELCVFVVSDTNDDHLAYRLYSDRFGSNTKIQFYCDGTPVRAIDNPELDTNKCEKYSEFILVFSSVLDLLK